MSVYKFQTGTYTGSIKGVNGILIQPPTECNDRLIPMAECCSIEIVESESFRAWKTSIKKDDLDGCLLTELPEVVTTMQNALDDKCTSDVKASFDLREEEHSLALILYFPTIFGRRSFAFRLNEVEYDKVLALQKQVALLRAELDTMKQEKEESELELRANLDMMKHNREATELELRTELDLMKRQKVETDMELRAELGDMVKQKEEETKLELHAALEMMEQKIKETELGLREKLNAINQQEKMENSFVTNK